MKNSDGKVVWPDDRYRVFSLVLSLVTATLLVGGLIIADLKFLTPLGALFFTAMYTVMDPKTPLQIKPRISKLLLGEGAFVSDHAIIWQNWEVIINIDNSKGDASVARQVEVKNRDDDPIRGYIHYFSFFNNQEQDPKIVSNKNELISVKDNEASLSYETITKSNKEYKFALNYSKPIKTGETYEYLIEADEVERAFPVEDGKEENWIADFAAPFEHMTITVTYESDVTFTDVDLKDRQTGNSLGEFNIRNSGNMIEVEAGGDGKRIRPGVYEFEWTLNHETEN